MTGFQFQKMDAIFFDFEGTLVNFQWKLEAAVDETLTALSLSGFPRDLYGDNPGYAQIYNHTLRLSSRETSPGEQSPQRKIMDAIYDRYDLDALTRWRLYPDTADVLSLLKQSNHKLGLISNIGNTALTAALEQLNIARFLDIVVSRNEMPFLKPHPEGLLTAAQTLGLSPDRILFVGDSRNDVAAAHAAGMRACYLVGGEDTPEKLNAFSPDLTVTTLSQLPELLKSDIPYFPKK
ncbi:MAG: HAD family hydrolase [Pseudomonadota bacterium]